jgi:hypothetical protein
MFDPVTALATLAPLAVDLGKSLIAKYVAPDNFKPVNIQEYVQVKEMDLKWFTALNSAGGTNPSYPWVEAIVRLQRPLVASVALLTWAYTHVMGIPSVDVDNFAAVIGFYLFGDRTLFYAKKAV